MNNTNSYLNKNKKPLLIAGPCSAETEEQVLETARQLKANGVSPIFRAGVWKPRTKPGGFEGVGAQGLAWLIKVKQELGFPVATEVANAKHVELALNSGIDIVWLGARTIANPFTVQEIADALRGANVEVMIKNPVVPDLALWIGAIERIEKAGIAAVAAIHRGFSGYQKTTYRNQPLWQIPIELKRQFPELPLLCDPSHIGGKREYLQEILQKAADLDYDGWMIETHIEPETAWSDSAQQITPTDLAALLNKITLRSPHNDGFIYSIQELRTHIDVLDEQLIELLAQRMKIAESIGRQKKVSGVTILQAQRRREIMKQALAKGAELGFPDTFIEELMELIHQESINRQTTIMNE